MRTSDLSPVTWRKSSHSNHGAEGNCVEIAELPDLVAMRDSKDPSGTALTVTRAQWRAFVSTIRSGELV